MDYTEIFNALEELERERGIPKEYMLGKIEAGLLTAFRRDMGFADNIAVSIDRDKKTMELIVRREVVEEVENDKEQIDLEMAKTISPKYGLGDVVETSVDPKNFGRISAQNAKQVIIQGIREFERDQIYSQFSGHQGEVLSCVVSRTDAKGASLEVNKTEIYLVAGEQIPGERLREGKHVKVYVVEVRSSAKGPQVMISRTHPGLVSRLFEMEVPEIAEGIVTIKNVAREAGSRTKIAVYSENPDIDPVGSCIGQKGNRVAEIVAELGGEKIDIVCWSEDPAKYIAEALSPAQVIDVEIIDERACRAIVPDDQLSLAIGKEGQNARLSAKLTGWKIDIKPASAV